jgi:hypothetical protein
VELPTWLVRLFDPADAYMRGDQFFTPKIERAGRRAARGLTRTDFGSGVLYSSSPPSAEDLAEAEREAMSSRREWKERLADVTMRHGALLDEKGAELVATGATVVRTTAGDMHARIVRFHWGDPVLEIRRPGGGHFKARLDRAGERDAERLGSYLVQQFGDLERGTEPLT